MQERLPDWVDPVALVERRAQLEGEIPLASLERLSDLLSDTEGTLHARMDFGQLADRRPGVQGRVAGRLRMPCQRCLQPVEMPVDLEFELYLVDSEAMAAQLPDAFEPLLNDTGRISPRELVENEVLLALPLIPRHRAGSCAAPEVAGADTGCGEAKPRRDNPFAVLEKLRKR